MSGVAKGNVTRFAGPAPGRRPGRGDGQPHRQRGHAYEQERGTEVGGRRRAGSRRAAARRAACAAAAMPSPAARPMAVKRQPWPSTSRTIEPERRAERQAHADFARALGDRPRQHAVEPEQRQQQRGDAERADQRAGDLLGQQRRARASGERVEASTGSAGSMDRMASRTAGASAAGSPAVRTCSLACGGSAARTAGASSAPALRRGSSTSYC